MILTAIYDLKKNEYFNFTFVHNEIDIIRYYQIMFQSGSDATFCKFPEDFQLFRLGSIDISNGCLINDISLIDNFVEIKRKSINEK